MLDIKEERISVLASQWTDPIADIAWAWCSYSKQRSDAAHLTPADIGRAHAMILLLAVMLESYSLRAAIDSGASESVKTAPHDVADWWTTTNYENLDLVLDAISIRNILAHNHLYSYSGEPMRTLNENFVGRSWQSKKLQIRVDKNCFVATGISCIPDKIGPKEAGQVAIIVRDALEFLRTTGASIGPVTFSMARGGEIQSLWDWISLATGEALRRQASAKQ